MGCVEKFLNKIGRISTKLTQEIVQLCSWEILEGHFRKVSKGMEERIPNFLQVVNIPQEITIGIPERIPKNVPKKFLHITKRISWNKSTKKIAASIPAIIVEEILNKLPTERQME